LEKTKSNSLFRLERTESSDSRPAFHVFKEDQLIAEVRGTDPVTQTVIPMRELSDYEESKLFEYIGNIETSVE
jgi:hypothetical protein